MQKQSLALTILIYGFAAVWVVLAAFPFLWTAWGSFKFETDFFGHWTKNLSGEDTAGFGQYFINLGYEIAFSPKKEFVRLPINTMVGVRNGNQPDIRHAGWIRFGAFDRPICLDPDHCARLPGHASHHVEWLYATFVRVGQE